MIIAAPRIQNIIVSIFSLVNIAFNFFILGPLLIKLIDCNKGNVTNFKQ